MKFLELLVEKGIIDAYLVDDILKKAEELGGDIFKALANFEIDKKALLAAKSEYFAVPAVSLEVDKISPDIFKYIPEESALHYQMVPVVLNEEEVLEVAMVDPGNIAGRNVLEFIFSESNLAFLISTINYSDYESLMSRYADFSGDVMSAAEEFDGSKSEVDSGEVESLEELLSKHEKDAEVEEEGKIVESAPVTKMVAAILMRAIEEGVSDIHIERTEHNSKVRYRLDGQMSVALMLPKRVHNAIVARIKILAKLKLDEKRKPQDGRFPARVKERNVDFRVSTMPTFYGEKVVIRILDPYSGVHSLEDTGMSANHLSIVQRALENTFGIILITGPTGSGKSTTLYSMLGQVDKEKHNVISLEDPVEYNIEGVNQSQVRSEIGYTFASGLRSILRQDPDIIMVGEIRDKETAQLAIQAALTGHLVFSTLHTNSSIGVIPRLVDMGVDPYLIAPTLRLAMAQRLVRRICPGAQKQIPVQGSMKELLDKQFADLPDEHKAQLTMGQNLHEAVPIEGCPTGQRGRIAVYEMFEVNSEIERIILDEPTEPKIYEAARKQGMITMKEDALLKCMDGTVAFRDVNTL